MQRIISAISFCKSYIELCIWLLIFAIGIRFFEAILMLKMNDSFGATILWNLEGLGYDISLFLRKGVFLLFLFVTACYFSEKISKLILRILFCLMIFLSLILVLFFTTSGYLLDNALFSYTFKEIILIIKTGSNTPVWVYFVIISLPTLFYFLSRKKIKINRLLLILFFALTLSSFFILKKLSVNTTQYHAKENKAIFFVESILKGRSSVYKTNPDDIIPLIEEFRSYFPENEFAEPEYPFLHKAIYKDVLSPFFNLKAEPPNIVIIIIEGMGYEHLYNDYKVMPFLDSLSKKSLSWVNCYSVSPRTFGVLPALFGNYPIGVKGFLEMCPYNPEFHSLPRILHQNNYTNFFFHGGPEAWLKMNKFSNQNNLLFLKDDEWDEDINNESLHSKWGFEDHLIFRQALRKLEQENKHPRMDIYLTNSTHLPWEYPNYYLFQEKVKNNSQFKKRPEAEKKKLYIYGGYAYADWSLQQLMEGYKKREDYENTIFIITGDHHSLSSQFYGAFNYRVPLIIYSPMLKESRKMKGVVSHRDITPTILSLLRNNYNFDFPEEITWLNTALDTSIHFNANTFSYLQTGDGMCEGVIYNNYLYCEGILDELSENGYKRIENADPKIINKLDRLLTLFKTADYYIHKNDALLRKKQSNSLHKTTVLNIHDTIAKRSHYAIRTELPVVEGPEGRHSTLFFDSICKIPINFFNYSFVDGDIESFIVNVEFKIFLEEGCRSDKLTLEIKLSKDNKHFFNTFDYLYDVPPNMWYDYKFAFPFRKDFCEEFGEGCYMKVFLFNNKQKGYIDDINVSLTIEKKQ